MDMFELVFDYIMNLILISSIGEVSWIYYILVVQNGIVIKSIYYNNYKIYENRLILYIYVCNLFGIDKYVWIRFGYFKDIQLL